MARRIFGYKNRLWLETHHYDYTGFPETVNLTAGEYLLMCRGARGGSQSSVEGYHGGVAYGVITLANPLTVYAYVGGNGNDASWDAVQPGGYNGGGRGGDRYSSSYAYGTSGGGATDIRLKRPEDIESVYYPTIPEDYQQVEYITFNRTSYIDTGIVPTMDYEYLTKAATWYNSSYSDMIIFGNSRNPGACCWFDYYVGSANNPEFVYHVGDYNYSSIAHNTISLQDGTPAVFYITRGACYIDGKPFIATDMANGNAGSSTLYVGRSHHTTSQGFWGNIYYFRIYGVTDNVRSIVREFVPCYRKSDNVIGFWDTVTEAFFPGQGATLNKGEDGSFPIMEYPTVEEEKVNESLKTRIIVAGGGGGASAEVFSTYNTSVSGYGGGLYGGPSITNSNDTSEYYNYIYTSHASQGGFRNPSRGYTFKALLGKGWDAGKQASNTNSCGGAGGGYFGGMAVIRNTSSGSQCRFGGGGGCGFLFTQLMRDKYGDDIHVPDEFQLTDTFYSALRAYDPSISICIPFDYNDILPDDVIEFPEQGDYSKFNLIPGSYTIKCWGGDGGNPIIASTNKGGYVQGDVDIFESLDLYAYVGGSGVVYPDYSNSTMVKNAIPGCGFNGGGQPSIFPGSGNTFGTYGGGASDIRLKCPDDFEGTAEEKAQSSLLTRFIVAGGGGGGAAIAGGIGGGEEGQAPSTSGSGTTPGPGTQDSTPQDQTYTDINGGFGYGGNSHNYDSSKSGGAGGGGWFGGSGTAATTSDSSPRGGSGGSGYVLTRSSYRPEGYDVPDSFILSNTELTAGGNNLPYGMTKIEVVCNTVFNYKLLCKDADGLKYYDEEQERWELLDQPETTSTFETYGSVEFISDVGLKQNYKILIYDPDDMFNKVKLEIVPPKQTVCCEVTTRMRVDNIFADYEADPSQYNVKFNVRKSTNSVDGKYIVTTTIEKLIETNKLCKIYLLGAISNN